MFPFDDDIMSELNHIRVKPRGETHRQAKALWNYWPNTKHLLFGAYTIDKYVT